MMGDVLERIEAYKREEIAQRKAVRSQSDIEAAAKAAPAPRGFLKALERDSERHGLGLIAEIKKASPSKGLIRADFDPPALAADYEAGGASCLSVLTDQPSFQGADVFLQQARSATALPVLRKDFLYDPWQVAESRALGADCILVILAAVDDFVARDLIGEATRWGMNALIEVHDELEMERALQLPSPLVGVNNRSLRSFEVSLDTFDRLAPMASKHCFLVGESGVFDYSDAVRLQKAGARALLVGESLMRQDNVAQATRDLMGR